VLLAQRLCDTFREAQVRGEKVRSSFTLLLVVALLALNEGCATLSGTDASLQDVTHARSCGCWATKARVYRGILNYYRNSKHTSYDSIAQLDATNGRVIMHLVFRAVLHTADRTPVDVDLHCTVTATVSDGEARFTYSRIQAFVGDERAPDLDGMHALQELFDRSAESLEAGTLQELKTMDYD
jgi:hypothetical protein